jgi:hypothetical protein
LKLADAAILGLGMDIFVDDSRNLGKIEVIDRESLKCTAAGAA